MVMLQVSFSILLFSRYCHPNFAGDAGKNNGKGYYIYKKGEKPRPDPSVLPIIEESRRLTNIMPGGKVSSANKRKISIQDLIIGFEGFVKI